MKVALCCIGRLENQYAVEFVEWYKKLGFNKIFIYDNNHGKEEHFEEVLQPYIDDGLVEVVPFRDMEKVQLKAYTDCYNTYGKDYDWMAFFDFDEFLVLANDTDIHSFLEKFNDFDCVKINWMTYTDNELINNDGRPVNERFTQPADFNLRVQYRFPENNHVKSIVRCGKENFVWKWSPHIPVCVKSPCNANGESSNNKPFQLYTFKNAYLKHFPTKTIEEYIRVKLRRGVADRRYSTFIDTYGMSKFFKYNKRTPEKVNFIKNLIINRNK